MQEDADWRKLRGRTKDGFAPLHEYRRQFPGLSVQDDDTT
jgi:hypothetical protein